MRQISPIPKNIKRLRASRGLSQKEIASEAGLSRNAFRSIETGQSDPRVNTLQGIAGALGVDLPALLAEPPRLSSVRLRSSKAQSCKAQATRDQIVIEVARQLKDFSDLEELLDRKKPYALGEVADRFNRIPVSERPIEAARLIREALDLGADEPIRDICGLLESAGVKVQVRVLEVENLFGLSVAAVDGGPAVVVNVRDDISVERRIFTAAHELGHLLLHPGAYDVEKVQEDTDEETQANRFASYFLMPNDVFLSEWGNTSGLPFVDRVLHVKRIFRVSYQTVLFRLVELRLVDSSKAWGTFKSKCRQHYGISLTKKVEPEALVEADKRLEPKQLDDLDFVEDRLSRLVRLAVESEKITLSRGAEILGMDLSTMREVAASWDVAA